MIQSEVRRIEENKRQARAVEMVGGRTRSLDHMGYHRKETDLVGHFEV